MYVRMYVCACVYLCVCGRYVEFVSVKETSVSRRGDFPGKELPTPQVARG